MINFYKNVETGKIEVKVPVCFQENNVGSMEFDSIEDVHTKMSNVHVVDDMLLGDETNYTEGSYEVDTDSLEHYVEEFEAE